MWNLDKLIKLKDMDCTVLWVIIGNSEKLVQIWVQKSL